MTEQASAKPTRPNTDAFHRAGIVALAATAAFALVDAFTRGISAFLLGKDFGAVLWPALFIGAIARVTSRPWPAWLYVVLVFLPGLGFWLSLRG
jgi:hypothetical protein